MNFELQLLLNNLDSLIKAGELTGTITRSGNSWTLILQKKNSKKTVAITCSNYSKNAELEIKEVIAFEKPTVIIKLVKGDFYNPNGELTAEHININKVFELKKGKYSWILDEHKQQLI